MPKFAFIIEFISMYLLKEYFYTILRTELAK